MGGTVDWEPGTKGKGSYMWQEKRAQEVEFIR